MKKTFVSGERLKKLRQDRGITQAELADVLKNYIPGMSQADPIGAPTITAAVISHYESGLHDPRLEWLLAYANFFNTSVDYLIGKTDIADRIEWAGNTLGISPMSAGNLASATCWGLQSVMDDFLRDDLMELVSLIEDYYIANFTPPPGVRVGFFMGTPSTPEEARIKERYEALYERGFEDIALSRIHEAIDARLKRMKAVRDAERAKKMDSPETIAAREEYDKKIREAEARGEIGVIQFTDNGIFFSEKKTR